MNRFAKHIGNAVLLLLLLPAALHSAHAGGYQGRAFVREANGAIGPTLRDISITFTREGGSSSQTAKTGTNGHYKLALANGRYRVQASHPIYQAYDSQPGFFVVTGQGWQTGNIFLQRRSGTLVLVVRHAEKASSDINTDLDPDPTNTGRGLHRAQTLAKIAAAAGVSAVYTTQWCRTAQTGQPSAQQQGLTIGAQPHGHPQAGLDACNPPITVPTQILPNQAASSAGLAQRIVQNHPGEVVLVVGHSNSAPEIVQALGTDSPCPDYLPGAAGGDCHIPDDQFNHLFVVNLPAVGAATLSHGTYGASNAGERKILPHRYRYPRYFQPPYPIPPYRRHPYRSFPY